jgi:hypothetical protein
MNTNTQKPECKIEGLTFFPIPTFDGPAQAFGADEKQYFNRRKIPDVPKKYEDMAQALFFKGGTLPDVKPEVDKAKAMAAVRAWLASWAPAHESKVGTVAYAFWVWCEGDLSLSNTKVRQPPTETQ